MYHCTCANASLTVSPAAAPGSRALRAHLYLRRSEEILVRPLRANVCSDDKLDGPQLQRIYAARAWPHLVVEQIQPARLVLALEQLAAVSSSFRAAAPERRLIGH